MATNIKRSAMALQLRIDPETGEWWEPSKRLGQRAERHPVAGVRVTVSQDAPRVTAGRVAALGVLALAAKKATIYLTFDYPDGAQVVVARPARMAEAARKFAAEVNTLSARGS